VITTTIQLRFDYDSTAIRPRYDHSTTSVMTVSLPSGVGVSLKVGDKYWEEWRAGVWGGTVPPQLGVWGFAAEKNQFCAKNYAIL